MSQKAFSKIWILVIVVAVVAGGIFTWQYFGLPKEEVKPPEVKVEDETINWMTYRNEEYGVELKYPKGLEVQESEREINGKLLNFNLYSGKERIFHLGTTDLGMEGHIRLYMIEGSEREVLVGGVKGSYFKIKDMKGEVEYIPHTLVKKYGRLYVFIGEGKVFDQILSTFQFITPKPETMEIKVYFVDTQMMIEGIADYKDMVKSVTRTIPKTQAVARAAIEELLKGPLNEERATYSSSIPKGVKINSLRIEKGTAYIDFSEELQAYGGGSAAAITIEWQIKKTLMQFPTVDEVIISIEGRTEDILQP